MVDWITPLKNGSGIIISTFKLLFNIAFRKKDIEDLIRQLSFEDAIENEINFDELPELDLKAIEVFLHSDIVIEIVAKHYRPSEKKSPFDIEKEFVQLFLANRPIQENSNEKNAKKIFSIVKSVCDEQLEKEILANNLSAFEYQIEKQRKEERANESNSSLKKIDEEERTENIRNYIENLLLSKDLSTLSNYLELTTISNEIIPVSDSEDKMEKNVISKRSLSELADQEKKIILTGEAGSGKTTSLKWLTIQFAKKYNQTKEGRIPVFVKLNNYSGEPFEQYIYSHVNYLRLNVEVFRYLLESDRLVILIDGLDLLTENKQIVNFVSLHSAQYFLSSRPGTFLEFSSDFKIGNLSHLSSEKIDLFVIGYLSDNPILAQELLNEIHQSYDLKELCENPLILRLIIRIAKRRKITNNIKPLPNTRVELFKEIISNMFAHLEEKSGKLPIPNQEIIDRCSDIAFELQTKNATTIPVIDVVNNLEQYLNAHPKRVDVSANTFFNYIKRTGILAENANSVEFSIHQSFQEYFSALKLVECLKNGKDVSKTFFHPKWQNVVIFVSEILENPDDFVNQIIDLGQFELASRCCKKVNPAIKNKLISKLKEKLLSSRSTLEKNEVMNSLIHLDDSIITLIKELAHDKNFQNRLVAISGLGKIKTRESVSVLEQALDDKVFFVSFEALHSLQKIGSSEAIEILIKGLHHKDPGIRSQAAFHLGWMKAELATDELIKMLNDEELVVRIGAIEALKQLKSEAAILACNQVLKDKGSDMRCRVAEALGHIKPSQNVAMLANALEDSDESVRWSASQSLGKSLSEQAVDPLVRCLCDRDVHVRTDAREALLLILKSNPAKHNEILLKIHDPVVNIWLQLNINKISLGDAIDKLKKLLQENKFENRLYSLEIIKEIDSDVFVPFFVEGLNDPDFEIQKLSAKILEKNNPKLSFDRYLKWLNNDNLEIRKIAITLVQDYFFHRSWDFQLNHLDSLNKERNPDLKLDAEILNQIVDSIIGLYDIFERHTRCDIIRILGDISNEGAIDKLIEIAKDKKSDCRSSSLIALKEIDSDRVKNTLLDVIEEKNSDTLVVWLMPSLGSTFSEKHLDRLRKISLTDDYILSQFALNEIAIITKEIESNKQVFRD